MNVVVGFGANRVDDLVGSILRRIQGDEAWADATDDSQGDMCSPCGVVGPLAGAKPLGLVAPPPRGATRRAKLRLPP